MQETHSRITTLLKAIKLEEAEEQNRFKLDKEHSLRNLKSEGLALHPLRVTHKQFGFADYPEFSFRLRFPCDTGRFRDGVAIELFCYEEEPLKGVLLSLDGKQGEIRLYAPDYPDWLESDGVGVKLAPDTRTNNIMLETMKQLSSNAMLFSLFQKLEGEVAFETESSKIDSPIELVNKELNLSQQEAVKSILNNPSLCIVHGPPGTGKTTTLIEAIEQLIRRGEKVVVSAPSNAAVDHVASGLITKGLNIVRVGNTVKISEQMLPYTIVGKLADKQIQREIKQLKHRAEEFRKMALKYKRNFGKAEREQRALLFKEVKNIRGEIRKMISYYEEKFLTQAQVVLGTPLGLLDSNIHSFRFNTLVLDEAGQCLEPLAWAIFPLAEKYVLAGDPFQLPPTVLSAQAAQLGLNISILEIGFKHCPNVALLNTQYRMREVISGFSSKYFYNDKLITPSTLADNSQHLIFIDTAGASMDEKPGVDGSSLINEGELKITTTILKEIAMDNQDIAFISPYAGQIMLAKDLLSKTIKISTIDSFQGQEYPMIIVSLVRSNSDGNIGFLSDVRRMNVALTRAKEKLIVIGDSSTIGSHKFYKTFLDYVEMKGEYKSVWEYEIE